MKRLVDLGVMPTHKKTVWLKFKVRSISEEQVVLETHPSLYEGETSYNTAGMICDMDDLYVETP